MKKNELETLSVTAARGLAALSGVTSGLTPRTRRFVVIAATVLAAFATFADPPPTPNVTTVTYINGRFNVAVWWREGVYNNTSGATLSCAYEIEMKGPGETEWSNVTGRGAFNTFDKNNYRFRCWTLQTNYFGSAEYRIRSKDESTSETSEWVELGAVKATVNVKGTPIYGNNCNGNGFDGYIHTLVDATGDSGNEKYIGYIFDEPTRIKSIRYLPRLDHMTLKDRYRNSLFQVASDDTFSNVETIHTVPSNFEAITGATEVVFAEPVTAKAVRHYKQIGGYEGSAEVEFIPADMPLKPLLSIGQTDLTDFHAVATWSFPSDFFCSTCRLERAMHKDGPWVAQSAWLDPTTDSLCVTNTDLYIGIPYYYRVVAYTDHPYFAGQQVYSLLSEYTRMRRLDRAWTDEAHLCEGVSVMVATNGAVVDIGNKRPASLAFDGNTSTFPDVTQDWCRHGPVGLDFGENVWIGAFGYICRNDNACCSRVGNAALYSASGNDPELLDKVQRSANVSQYSQTTTLYIEPTTSNPAEGARWWFLWGNSSSRAYQSPFYGNVAELMFFGWTAADKAAAPVVSPPASITFARGATGPVVSWMVGTHVETYTLKRRPRGETEWTEVATVPAATLSCYDENLASGFYEYCVVADGGEMGVATSDVFSYAWYVPGNGTGLAGAVMWPYCSTNMIPWQMTSSASRGVEAVNINLGSAAEIAHGVTAHACMVWEGSLLVPFSGTYTIKLETDAGGAVAIDDVFACNSWTGGTQIPTGDINLTAGEHKIRVDYRLSDDDAPTKKCILRWSGPVAEEVIPASQLVPAAVPPSPMVDGWTGVSYHMDRVGQFLKVNDGRYKIRASSQSMGGPTAFNAAFMWKRMSGPFAIEAKVQKGNGYGECGIMVQGDNGHFVAPYLYTQGALSYYGLKKFVPGDASWEQTIPWIQFGNTANWDCYLRVEKCGREMKFYWKDLKTDPWTEIYSFIAPSGMFGREVAVGFTVNGFGGGDPAQGEFSEITVKAICLPTIIMLK